MINPCTEGMAIDRDDLTVIPCDANCQHCGFNPAVIQGRLDTGKFKTKTVNGKRCKQLVFPKNLI